jgi:hypothetical protein
VNRGAPYLPSSTSRAFPCFPPVLYFPLLSNGSQEYSLKFFTAVTLHQLFCKYIFRSLSSFFASLNQNYWKERKGKKRQKENTTKWPKGSMVRKVGKGRMKFPVYVGEQLVYMFFFPYCQLYKHTWFLTFTANYFSISMTLRPPPNILIFRSTLPPIRSVDRTSCLSRDT